VPFGLQTFEAFSACIRLQSYNPALFVQVAAASNPKKDFAFTIGTLTELGQKATGSRHQPCGHGLCNGQLLPKMC